MKALSSSALLRRRAIGSSIGRTVTVSSSSSERPWLAAAAAARPATARGRAAPAAASLARLPAPTRAQSSRAAGSPAGSSSASGSAAVAAAGVNRRALLGSLVLGGGALADLAGSGGRSARSVAHAATVSEIEKVLVEPKWPDKWPWRPEDFLRYDESDDSVFYDAPRFVYHIDDGAVKALTNFYQANLPPSGRDDVAVLDICSSWVSHYPPGYTAGRVVALGMNEQELKANSSATEYVVHDLNLEPDLPFPDDTFDVVTNAVSVDYLNKPLEVFQELHRVLKPGGVAYMSFSNRCFPTKAIALWTATGDADHVWIVGSYFHYSVPNGGFEPPQAKDISPSGGLFGKSDPMYVVFARKAAAAGGAGAAAGGAAAAAAAGGGGGEGDAAGGGGAGAA